MRALVVEDTASSRLIAHKVLVRCGYTVVLVGSLLAARGVIQRQQPFALVLLDAIIKLDERSQDLCDGLAFAFDLKKKWPEARLIIWSAADKGAEAAACGAAFVLKDAHVHRRLAEAIGADNAEA